MEPSAVRLICPACDERTAFRSTHDGIDGPSAGWRCRSCGHPWCPAPLEVRDIGRAPWALGVPGFGALPDTGAA